MDWQRIRELAGIGGGAAAATHMADMALMGGNDSPQINVINGVPHINGVPVNVLDQISAHPDRLRQLFGG